MDSLTDDIWTMVLARLPIKIFICFKLVCKQWKSILESPFFRNLFLSLHQNSASSWSLMSTYLVEPEMVGYYQCDTWGLKRPLGSSINSFLIHKNSNPKYRQVSVVAYSDVGLILIYAMSNVREKSSLYVFNPVSHECVEIFLDHFPKGFERSQLCFWQWGIATRIENGILSYKVVVFEQRWGDTMLSCLMYSSETGLWSLDDTSFFNYDYSQVSISLNSNLHWLAKNDDNQEVVLSMALYTNSTGSERCRVSPFPDLEKTTKFSRACTPCHGFLMYMNIVSTTKVDESLEDKLCVWRLQSEGWQLIFEISPGSILTNFDYVPMTINPFDAKTAYFWSKEHDSLLYINLHNGKFVVYNQYELTSDGRAMILAHDPRAVISLKGTYIDQTFLVPFILPQWLYRIPDTVTRV